MPQYQPRPFTPNALRRLRLNTTLDGRKPLTQFQVAELIGVGLNRYFQLEQNRVQPTPREMRRLAQIFGVHPKDLGILPRHSNHVVVRRK